MARKLPACGASSTRARSSRSPTARSPRRSTSRSGSSRSTRSASRRSCCSASALLFLLVALSYAEATSRAARDGRRRDVRPPRLERPRRLHDRLGALPRLPDRDRALGALRAALPRRARSRSSALERNPWDVVVGVCVIVVVGAIRLVRRPVALRARHARPGARRAHAARAGRLRLRAPLLAAARCMKGTDLGTAPTVHSLLFAIPLAMLAFTGLETVANLAEEAQRARRRPARARSSSRSARSSPPTSRSPSSALSAFPGPRTELGTVWLRAPLVGIAERDPRAHVPTARRHDPLLRRRERRADPRSPR